MPTPSWSCCKNVSTASPRIKVFYSTTVTCTILATARHAAPVRSITLKISSSLKNAVVNSVPATRNGTGAAPANASGGGKSPVDLSSTARNLASLQNSDNDVNLDRIREVRDAIAAGQLKVDPSRIADSLLASVRELLK